MPDPKAYISNVEARRLLSAVRAATGLTQEAVARRAGTSQATLSAYERGKKSPTLAVTDRILHALGYELDAVPRVTFAAHDLGVGDRVFYVPDRLWRLSPTQAFASVPAVKKQRGRAGGMGSRERRVETYIALLEQASPEELLSHLDGVLLVDRWPEIAPHLHEDVREAWAPLVRDALESGADQLLVEGLRSSLGEQPRHAGRTARLRAVERMVELGVPYEAIAKVLSDRRQQEVAADDDPLAAYRRRRRIKALQRKVASHPGVGPES